MYYRKKESQQGTALAYRDVLQKPQRLRIQRTTKPFPIRQGGSLRTFILYYYTYIK